MDNNLIVKENTTRKWFGAYKGVGFEINRFFNAGVDSCGIAPSSYYTYYLKINLNRLDNRELADALWLSPSESKFSKGVSYNYNIDSIENMSFHGGCTYYSKESGFDGDDKVVKIGCDYNHLWDENHQYSYDEILVDVKHSIECLLSMSSFKQWCNGNGKLYNLTEGKLINGVFYSEEHWGDKEIYINA